MQLKREMLCKLLRLFLCGPFIESASLVSPGPLGGAARPRGARWEGGGAMAAAGPERQRSAALALLGPAPGAPSCPHGEAGPGAPPGRPRAPLPVRAVLQQSLPRPCSGSSALAAEQ